MAQGDETPEQAAARPEYRDKLEVPLPVVHPANAVTWHAYSLVADCRVHTFGGVAGLDWARIAAVLEMHDRHGRNSDPGLWTPAVHHKLRIVSNELLAIEQEKAKTEREFQELQAKTGIDGRKLQKLRR